MGFAQSKGYPQTMRKRAAALILALLGTSLLSISIQEPIALASTCGSSFQYPNGCKLGQDSTGQFINPITTCHNYDSVINGDLTNPGRDWILNVVEEDVGSNATVSAPHSGKIALTVNLDCRGWLAYQFTGALVAPDGSRYPISFNSGTLSNQDDTYDTSDYCFLKQLTSHCKWLDIEGTYTVPTTAPSGTYALSLHSKSLPVAVGIVDPLLPPEKDFLYKSAVIVNSATPLASPSSSPSPSPTTSPTSIPSAEPAPFPVFSLSYLGSVITVHFSATDVATYLAQNPFGQAVIRVTNAAGTSVTGTPFTFKQGEATSTITNVTSGIWSVQIAGINSSGQGPWSSPQLISAVEVPPSPTATPAPAPAPTSQPKVITWKCIKGKSISSFKGSKPSCPKGYTLKK